MNEIKRQRPLISIIIPTYKNRGGLYRSIQSALNQTYTNIEVIVVDDNSPESEERSATENIMEEFLGNPKVIYLKHEENKNGAAARNTGIKVARGQYIAFLDDDDEWLPSKLDLQEEFMHHNKQYDCVYCLAYINNREEYTKCYEGNATMPMLMNRTKMFTPCLVFQAASLKAIGGFDESFRRHQDYELLTKFFSHDFQIGCLRERLVVIHSLGGNVPSMTDFIGLKKKFLETFSPLINELESRFPGARNKIVASNFAVVFDSAIASHNLRIAFNVLISYMGKSPISFFSQLLFINVSRFYRKFGKTVI